MNKILEKINSPNPTTPLTPTEVQAKNKWEGQSQTAQEELAQRWRDDPTCWPGYKLKHFAGPMNSTYRLLAIPSDASIKNFVYSIVPASYSLTYQLKEVKEKLLPRLPNELTEQTARMCLQDKSSSEERILEQGFARQQLTFNMFESIIINYLINTSLQLTNEEERAFMEIAEFAKSFAVDINPDIKTSIYEQSQNHMEQVIQRAHKLPENYAGIALSLLNETRLAAGKNNLFKNSPLMYYVALICQDFPDSKIRKRATGFLQANDAIFEHILEHEKEVENRGVWSCWHAQEDASATRPTAEDYKKFNNKLRPMTYREKLDDLKEFGLEKNISEYDVVKKKLSYFIYLTQCFLSLPRSHEIEFIIARIADMSHNNDFDSSLFRPSRKPCRVTDPRGRALPKFTAQEAEKHLQRIEKQIEVNPTIRRRADFAELIAKLQDCISRALEHDRKSKKQGVVWTQLAYLLRKDIAITELTEETLKCRADLQALVNCEEMMSNFVVEPAGLGKKKKNKNQSKNKSVAHNQQINREVAAEVKTLSINDRVAFQIPIPVEPAAVGLADALDFKVMFKTSNTVIKWFNICGVNLPTRMTPAKVKWLLDEHAYYYGPLTNPEEIINAKAKIARKHGYKHWNWGEETKEKTFGMTVEECFAAALAFFNEDFKEKRAWTTRHAANLHKKVKYIYGKNRFATYSEDGKKVITYCDRNICKGNHYASL